jgi:hypothetical protein
VELVMISACGVERPEEFNAGPLASLDTVLSYHGRYFVGQALTEALPYVFELVPAKETTLEMILPTNDNKPN